MKALGLGAWEWSFFLQSASQLLIASNALLVRRIAIYRTEPYILGGRIVCVQEI